MSDGTLSWRQVWTETASRIGRPQARWMCEVASGLDGEEFIEALDQLASQRGVAHLDSMLTRYAAGEPLQYVLGRWGFRHLDLMVDRRVLIPRPETESVVEVALQRARSMDPPIVCADLGTGSGAIGLSLAMELPNDGVTVWMTDRSSDALDVARANTAGIGRAAANVLIAEGDWFAALPQELQGQLSLIVCNPPYVADADPELEAIVRDWEPAMALFAGADGLDEVRRVVADSSLWLAPGGWLVMEIGATHGPRVEVLLREASYDDVTVSTDLNGKDRVAAARRPSAGSGEAGRQLPEQ
jgi:release factor glutamine methyltransferase